MNELVDKYRTLLATTLQHSKASVVEALNQSGFPTTYSVNNDDIITHTLKAMHLSNTFTDKLNNLIIKNNQQQIQAMFQPKTKLNFSQQPEVMTILNANNLTTKVVPFEAKHGFLRNRIFDNCNGCNKFTDMNTSNYSASFDSSTLLDIFKTGAGAYTAEQQAQAQQDTAAAAIKLEQLKIQQAQAAAAAAAATNASSASKIKAYGLPIAITGVLVIGGIAAYFYFKKK